MEWQFPSQAARTEATAIDIDAPPAVSPTPSVQSTQRSNFSSVPSVQREPSVLLHGAAPKLSEMLKSVGDRALILDQMVQAGGRFYRGAAPPRAAVSGLEILGEVEDYEDAEESRHRNMEALVSEHKEDVGKESTYPPRGSSHMADLFYSMGKRPS